MSLLLCIAPRCRHPRHQPGCTDQQCADHPAWPAAPGLRLCDRHTQDIARDAATAAQLYDELALRLLGGSGGGEPVSGTADRTRLPNPAAVEARATIRHVLVAWCRLISEERGFRPPADDVHAMAAYLGRSAEWLAATDYADEASDELYQLGRGRAWGIAYPTGVRRITPGPCPDAQDRPEDFIGPMPRCPGTLAALMRPEDLLLPSELICSANPKHRWPSYDWRDLGKQIDPDKVRWRYMAAVEIAEEWRLPLGTVWWLASRDQWRRSADGRRPTLYLIDDVRATMEQRGSVAA